MIFSALIKQGFEKKDIMMLKDHKKGFYESENHLRDDDVKGLLDILRKKIRGMGLGHGYTGCMPFRDRHPWLESGQGHRRSLRSE